MWTWLAQAPTLLGLRAGVPRPLANASVSRSFRLPLHVAPFGLSQRAGPGRTMLESVTNDDDYDYGGGSSGSGAVRKKLTRMERRLLYTRLPHPKGYGPRAILCGRARADSRAHAPKKRMSNSKRELYHERLAYQRAMEIARERELERERHVPRTKPRRKDATTPKPAKKRALAPGVEVDWALVADPSRMAPEQGKKKNKTPPKSELYGMGQFAHLLPANTPRTPTNLLAHFLDSNPDQSSRKFNVHAVITLYRLSRAQNGSVAERYYSLLIALFGALSVLTSAYEFMLLPPRATPTSLLVQMIPNSYQTDHWRFIKMVADDKQAAGYSLGLIDHYWLMRGALTEAAATDITVPDRQTCFSRAIVHYQHISTEREPLFHTTLFSELIARGEDDHAEYALAGLTSYLERHKGLDASLRDVLWGFVLSRRSDPSEGASQYFWQTLRKRLSRPAKDTTHRKPQPRTVTTSKGEVFIDFAPPTIEEVYTALCDTILNPSSIARCPWPELVEWAKLEMKMTVLAREDLAWQYMTLLAHASQNVPLTEYTRAVQLRLDDAPRGTRWILLCSLLALARPFQTGSSGDVESARMLLDALWDRWRYELYLAPAERLVDRALLLEFARLAGLLGHKMLLHKIGVKMQGKMQTLFLKHEDYIRTGPFGDTGRAGAALTFGAALVLTGMPWPTVCKALQHTNLVATSKGFNNYANQLVRQVLRQRLYPAAVVYLQMVRAGVKFADQTRVEMCQAFARRPRMLPLAMRILRGREMPRTKMAAVFIAVTRSVYANRLPRAPPFVMRSLVPAMQRHAYAPTPGTREHAYWRWTLLAAARSEAHDAVVALLEERLHECSRRFVMALAGVLLSRRLFRCAARLLEAIPRSHPGRASVARMVVARASRAGARRVAAGAWRQHRRAAGREGLVFRAAGFDLRAPRSRVALALRWYRLGARRHRVALRTSVQLLVRLGRWRAAERLYTSARPEGRTATEAGNALLGVAMRPRRTLRLLRQVRRVFSMAAALAAGGAFKPDRVTLNILVKALLHWDRVLSAPDVLALFNALAAAGAMGAVAPLPTVGVPAAVPMLGVLQHILAAQRAPPHARRHVRPLLRLFVLAFRARGAGATARMVSRRLSSAMHAAARQRREFLLRDAARRRLGRHVLAAAREGRTRG